MRTWTAKMRGHDVSITSDRLAEFGKFYVSDPDLASRMSELLWLDMYVLDQEFGVGPRDILKSIEVWRTASRTVASSQPVNSKSRPSKDFGTSIFSQPTSW
ncbi:hypothetical protein IVA80_20565 [Bradyrhizobium sp. 139]|uniref:hypothetical protein n=1 Tax=Bradyrhizobium sp. 139 TaxID=2782616 RepID=UPI001FFBD6E3|nr:hypothetical protein [Bradyrhizobium sp. 139]MCK1743189.1 hypothetical protein [Bradyrhizobium sp. 139]